MNPKVIPIEIVNNEIISLMTTSKAMLRTVAGIGQLLEDRIPIELTAESLGYLIGEDFLTHTSNGVIMLGGKAFDLSNYDPNYFVTQRKIDSDAALRAGRTNNKKVPKKKALSKKVTPVKAGKVMLAKTDTVIPVKVEKVTPTEIEKVSPIQDKEEPKPEKRAPRPRKKLKKVAVSARKSLAEEAEAGNQRILDRAAVRKKERLAAKALSEERALRRKIKAAERIADSRAKKKRAAEARAAEKANKKLATVTNIGERKIDGKDVIVITQVVPSTAQDPVEYPHQRYSKLDIEKTEAVLNDLIEKGPSGLMSTTEVMDLLSDKLSLAVAQGHSLTNITAAINSSGVMVSKQLVSKSLKAYKQAVNL